MRVGRSWIGVLFVGALAAGCGEPPPDDDDGGMTMVCASDVDCDDGLFCNGPETCAPDDDAANARGCVGVPPCMESQRCLEEEDRCATSCAVNADADGDGFDAITCGGADCDDTDPDRFPGNVEVCDDAGHDEDCSATTFGATDVDRDTYVSAACCNTDDDGVMQCGDDCNDQRADAHPGATEACESVDNDCDGATDEGLLVRHYRDADFDLHGVPTESDEVCPGTPGWSLVDDDCDDTSALRHGAQLEICDVVDNDCDGTVDESPVSITWYPDEDGDGFGAIPASGEGLVISCAPVDGYSTRSSDCDDTDANVRPGQGEVCNGIDDDCNGRADAGEAGDLEDDDGDGFADVRCGGSDCNDADGSINADGIEICNGIDDDCDGLTDGADANAQWYLDRDRDGFGDPGEAAIESCDPQPGRVPRAGDCDDDRADIRPGVADLCDGIDADCDGAIDESGVRFAFYPDVDGDGWGTSDTGAIVFRCSAPSGTSQRTGDCADDDEERHPGALEQCQGTDDDCDEAIDEDADRMWYLDGDGDGHGVGAGEVSCLAIPGRAPLGDDCDDADAGNFPGNDERCDGTDDDCDGSVDDGASSSCDALHASGVCTDGACSLTCDASYGDCDGDVGTGCEADLRRSAFDCGACDAACGLADTCGIAPATAGTCNESPIVELTGVDLAVIGRRATGSTFGWGHGRLGQHGLGTTNDTAQPARGQVDDAIQLAMGEGFGCALRQSGAVQCWGYNQQGQLGLGTGIPTSRTGAGAVPLPGPAASICTGAQHACAALRDGSVYCWGQGQDGRIGDGIILSGVRPVTRVFASDGVYIEDAVGCSATALSTCILRERAPGNRYVSCVGYNRQGQLGQGTESEESFLYPLDVPGLPTDIVSMRRGLALAHGVLTSSGRVYFWGGNSGVASSSLTMGLGSGSSPSQPVPVTPPGLGAGVTDVMLHYDGGCAIRRNGGAHELLCWGYAGAGSLLGNGATGNVSTPTIVGAVDDPFDDVTAMMTGFQGACAVRADGNIWCVGADTRGQLGNGLPLTSTTAPVQVIGLP